MKHLVAQNEILNESQVEVIDHAMGPTTDSGGNTAWLMVVERC